MAKKSWFAVKSLFRIEVFGDPVEPDDDYEPNGMLVEERVVHLKARSFKDALRRGAEEADEYCARFEFVNSYGQTVRMRRVDVVEAFYPFEPDAKRPEVWSSTTGIPASVTDQELELMRFGPDESKEAFRKRKKFLDPEILKLVRQLGDSKGRKR